MPLKLEGMDDLLSKLSKLEHPEFAKERALDVGAEHMRQKIADATRRSGINHDHTADHIVVAKKNDSREIGPDKEHYYYRFVEFGRSDQPNRKGKGELARTFNAEIKTTQNKMADVLKRMLGL